MALLSFRYTYEGTETTETSITRTGSPPDPTGSAQSRKIVTTANSQWLRPFKAEPYTVWNPTAGANVTLTVYGVVAGALPNNDDIWLELNYLGSASDTLGSIVTTTKSNVLAAGAAVASDSSTWPTLVNSYANPGGSGDRISSIIITTTAVLAAGAITMLINGTQANELWWTNGQSGCEIKFDFGTARNITEAMWYQDSASTHGNWKWQGSNDNSIWTDIGTTFTLGGTLQTITTLSANTNSWRYYRLLQTAGVTSSGPYLREIEFKINSTTTPFKLTKILSSPQPGLAGYIDVRVRVAKPSSTYYIDPTVELTAAAGGTYNAATAYKSSRYTYEGTETTETSIVRVNGAKDPTGQAQSRKIVTTANSQWLRPFKAEPYAQWNNVTGANVSVTVCGVINSGALPLNDEIWMDVEYLTLAGQAVSTQFDGAPTAGVVMSNGNLTVTHGTTNNASGVSSLTTLASGKYYFEVTVSVWSGAGSNANGVGVGAYYSGTFFDATGVFGNGVGVSLGSVGALIYSQGTNTLKDIGAIAAGDIIGVAIDLTAKLAWFRKNNGTWNASGTANPATGVGGVAFTTGTVAPFVRFSSAPATDAFIANFGATSYVYAAPSGFGNWATAPVLLGKIVTTTKANVLASGTAVASDSSTWSGTAPSSGAPLDAVASVTGAWSLGRDMKTSFAGGTRYTKSGTAIITIEDQSGNNRDFTDGGLSSRRPVEATAFPANVLCADFNGSTHYLPQVALSNFITASSGAIVVSVIVDAVSVNDAISYHNHAIIADSGQYTGLYARNLSGVTFYAYNYDGTEDAPSTTGSVGTAYVLMWRHHGGNQYVSINGGTEVTVASGNTSVLTGALVLGGDNVGSFCDCKIAEVFTTSDGSQTAALAAAIAKMKSYVGIVDYTPFKLTTTLSSPQPGVAGYIHVRPRVAKASSTFYIDPKITLS